MSEKMRRTGLEKDKAKLEEKITKFIAKHEQDFETTTSAYLKVTSEISSTMTRMKRMLTTIDSLYQMGNVAKTELVTSRNEVLDMRHREVLLRMLVKLKNVSVALEDVPSFDLTRPSSYYNAAKLVKEADGLLQTQQLKSVFDKLGVSTDSSSLELAKPGHDLQRLVGNVLSKQLVLKKFIEMSIQEFMYVKCTAAVPSNFNRQNSLRNSGKHKALTAYEALKSMKQDYYHNPDSDAAILTNEYFADVSLRLIKLPQYPMQCLPNGSDVKTTHSLKQFALLLECAAEIGFLDELVQQVRSNVHQQLVNVVKNISLLLKENQAFYTSSTSNSDAVSRDDLVLLVLMIFQQFKCILNMHQIFISLTTSLMAHHHVMFSDRESQRSSRSIVQGTNLFRLDFVWNMMQEVLQSEIVTKYIPYSDVSVMDTDVEALGAAGNVLRALTPAMTPDFVESLDYSLVYAVYNDQNCTEWALEYPRTRLNRNPVLGTNYRKSLFKLEWSTYHSACVEQRRDIRNRQYLDEALALVKQGSSNAAVAPDNVPLMPLHVTQNEYDHVYKCEDSNVEVLYQPFRTFEMEIQSRYYAYFPSKKKTDSAKLNSVTLETLPENSKCSRYLRDELALSERHIKSIRRSILARLDSSNELRAASMSMTTGETKSTFVDDVKLLSEVHCRLPFFREQLISVTTTALKQYDDNCVRDFCDQATLKQVSARSEKDGSITFYTAFSFISDIYVGLSGRSRGATTADSLIDEQKVDALIGQKSAWQYLCSGNDPPLATLAYEHEHLVANCAGVSHRYYAGVEAVTNIVVMYHHVSKVFRELIVVLFDELMNWKVLKEAVYKRMAMTQARKSLTISSPGTTPDEYWRRHVLPSGALPDVSDDNVAAMKQALGNIRKHGKQMLHFVRWNTRVMVFDALKNALLSPHASGSGDSECARLADKLVELYSNLKRVGVPSGDVACVFAGLGMFITAVCHSFVSHSHFINSSTNIKSLVEMVRHELVTLRTNIAILQSAVGTHIDIEHVVQFYYLFRSDTSPDQWFSSSSIHGGATNGTVAKAKAAGRLPFSYSLYKFALQAYFTMHSDKLKDSDWKRWTSLLQEAFQRAAKDGVKVPTVTPQRHTEVAVN